MGKLTKFFLVLSLTAVLSGCQIVSQKAPDQGTIDHVPQDRRIGVIQSLGAIKTNSQGTDILTMDDGSTILLRSLTINLDDQKYLKNKVEVSGVLTYTTDGKQIMEVQSIDVLETAPVTQQLVTTSWRDYVNAAMGFQVKYRDDFKLEESGNFITFTRKVAQDKDAMTQQTQEKVMEHIIAVNVNPVSTSFGESPQGYPIFSKSRVGKNGIEAEKYSSGDGLNLLYRFNSNKHLYSVAYSGGTDAQATEDQNVFYEFLASFELLDGDVSTSQQTFVTDVPATTPVVAPVAPVGMPPEPTFLPDMSMLVTNSGAPVEGYASFTSSGYKFSIQYPKGWYFGQATTTDSGVSRRYNFGTKPVDQEPGSVNLDIGTKMGDLAGPAGTVTYSFTGKNGRIYRMSGPGSLGSTLKTMLSTIQEQ